MPTINHEPIPIPIFTDFDGVICRKWPAMANGDVGEPIALTRYSDRTVQVTGTPGAGGVGLAIEMVLPSSLTSGQIDFRVAGFVAP